jgi:hypothetical protein
MHEFVVNWCRTKLSCLVGAADLRSEKACFISRIKKVINNSSRKHKQKS